MNFQCNLPEAVNVLLVSTEVQQIERGINPIVHGTPQMMIFNVRCE